MKNKKILLSMAVCSLLSLAVSMQAGELDHLEQLRKRLDAEDQAGYVAPQDFSYDELRSINPKVLPQADLDRLEALKDRLDAENRHAKLALMRAQVLHAKQKADKADQDEKDQEEFREMYVDANSKTRAESGLSPHHESLPYIHDVNMNQ